MMVNKCDSGDMKAKGIGTGASSGKGVISYKRTSKSFRSR